MDKEYTKEQLEILDIILSGEKTEFWRLIVKQLDVEIKEIEDILCGRKKIVDGEDKTKISNLDEVKYSMNTVLRDGLNKLINLKNYPDKVKKSLGIVKIDNNTQK